MIIIHNPSFEKELKSILRYIANDKLSASIKFKNELKSKIRKIPENPFQYRKSFYFNNKNIRDMIYRGYTIIYEVNLQEDTVEILKIFNQNKP